MFFNLEKRPGWVRRMEERNCRVCNFAAPSTKVTSFLWDFPASLAQESWETRGSSSPGDVTHWMYWEAVLDSIFQPNLAYRVSQSGLKNTSRLRRLESATRTEVLLEPDGHIHEYKYPHIRMQQPPLPWIKGIYSISLLLSILFYHIKCLTWLEKRSNFAMSFESFNNVANVQVQYWYFAFDSHLF